MLKDEKVWVATTQEVSQFLDNMCSACDAVVSYMVWSRSSGCSTEFSHACFCGYSI